MKIVGIIAEYHPFHNGHEAQIAMLRQQGFDKVIVAMSTDVVQRGQLALLPARVRAEAAVRCGADMVVAIPAPYACATAEKFAQAGVALLGALGVDTLAFGVENVKSDAFLPLAQLLLGEEWQSLLREQLATGQTFAAARQKAVQQLHPAMAALLNSPNNILALEYCKAILQQGHDMNILPLPRLGAEHDGTEAGDGFASASYLRSSYGWEEALYMWQSYVPEAAMRIYEWAEMEELFTVEDRVEIAILSRLRAMSIQQLRTIRGISEGLENRLFSAVRRAATLEELLDEMKTRRYPYARLRRLVLDAALGYTEKLPPLPPYLWVLGAKREALSLLKTTALPAGTSLARLEKISPETAFVAQAEYAAADLAALCRRRPQSMGTAQTQKPVLL